MHKLKHNFDELEDIDERFIYLKNELDLIKELNNKTKEFLLLEFESILDKQNQVQMEQNTKVNSFNEIINLLKKENAEYIENISKLNEEIGKYKQLLKNHLEFIDELKLEKDNFKNIISIKDEEIISLGNSVEDIKQKYDNIFEKSHFLN